jgi:Spy/CpxP family protein refolding chaperone
MKSAYELAMERLNASDPDAAKPLTPEQKAKLAEIDRIFQGKIAEREIFLKQQLEAMLAASKWDEAEKIKKQLASEKARIAEEREDEKQKLRSGFGKAKT